MSKRILTIEACDECKHFRPGYNGHPCLCYHPSLDRACVVYRRTVPPSYCPLPEASQRRPELDPGDADRPGVMPRSASTAPSGVTLSTDGVGAGAKEK